MGPDIPLKPSGRPIILHVHQGRTSFVAKDLRLLSSAFDVVELPSVWKRKWEVPYLLLAQAIRLLVDRRWQAVVVQFSGYHAILPALVAKLRSKPCFIITGGTDCVSFPSLSYGNFARQPLAAATALAFRLCTHILPVHLSLMRSRNTFQTDDPVDQGVLSFMPTLNKPVTEIPNGYDPDQWPLGPAQRKVDVLTVAAQDRRPSTIRLKGISLLMSMAEKRPGLNFQVIGLPAAPVGAPPNITFTPAIPNNLLAAHYGTAKVYAQLSLSEGFPNALCEAMLCGCTPLVSKVAAMPGIVQGTGEILETQDLDNALAGLDRALHHAAQGPNKAAHDRIASGFTEAARRDALVSCIADAMERPNQT